MSISTRIFDRESGEPHPGVVVLLEFQVSESEWTVAGTGISDSEGRVQNLVSSDFTVRPGLYKLIYDTDGRPGAQQRTVLTFEVTSLDRNYHIPMPVGLQRVEL